MGNEHVVPAEGLDMEGARAFTPASAGSNEAFACCNSPKAFSYARFATSRLLEKEGGKKIFEYDFGHLSSHTRLCTAWVDREK